MSLSERVYNCEKCNLNLDRDINAATNIKKVALLQIGQGLPESKPVAVIDCGSCSGGDCCAC